MVTLGSRLVRALGRAAPPTAWPDAERWARERDAWLDRLDPSAAELDAADRRALVAFLAESTPSRGSRMTATEWRADLDLLTAELLMSGPPAP